MPFALATYEVNVKKLKNNIHKIKNYAWSINKNIKYLLPVKGDGYGSGMIHISHFVQENNLCDYLGVAQLSEAFELRESGITLPILVLGQTVYSEKFLKYIAEQNIEIAISDEMSLKEIENFLHKNHVHKHVISVHLKLDLGMGRGGVLQNNAMCLLQKILHISKIKLKGVMMHFPVSDSMEKENFEYTEMQIMQFVEFKKQAEKIIPKDEEVLFHCANSGGALEHENAVRHFDMIRPGIASYGYPERGKVSDILDLEPIVSVYSHFSLVKTFPKNFSIGYGRTYYTQTENENIALLPIGYADGLNRKLSNNFSVFSESGQELVCVGRISMDQSAFHIPKNFDTSQKIYVLGVNQNAKRIASLLETISYEILIAFGTASRIERKYII